MAEKKHPNVVVFCTDEQPGHWLGCMGNPDLKTPNIDELAENGILFQRAYCNTPICMASRATMFTGLPTSVNGSRTNGIPLLEGQDPTLPGILSQAGYETMSIGKLHLTNWEIGTHHAPEYTDIPPYQFPESETHWRDGTQDHIPPGYFGLNTIDFIGNHGWYCHGDYTNWLKANHPDQYEKFVSRETSKPSLCYEDARYGNVYATIDDKYYYNEWIKDRTIARIDAVPQGKPFFAWVSFPDPHWPYGPPAPYNTMYDPEKIDKPVAWDDDKAEMPDFFHKEWYTQRKMPSVDGQDTDRTLEQVMEAKALSYGMTTAVDTSIGQIVQHLKDTGLYDDTVFIFLSDHGDNFGDHKMFNKGPFHYEGCLHIPFVVCYPKKLKRGLKSDTLVQTMDFMPTVLDLAGVDYPVPNGIPDWQGFAPDSFPLYDTNSLSRLPGKSLVPVMTGEAECVHDYILVEDDDDIRRIILRTLITPDYKLGIFLNREDGILFDRAKDPEERHNAWNDPAYREIKAKLMEQMAHALLSNVNRVRRRISIA